MKLTQKNCLKLDAKQFNIINLLCGYSKNLANVTLWEIDQHYQKTGKYLRYEEAYHIVKQNVNYSLILSSSAQHTMKVIDSSFRSYFGSLQSKKKSKKKVNKPRYLKKDGKFLLKFPKTGFRIKEDKVYIGLPKKFKQKHKAIVGDIRDLVIDLPTHLKGIYKNHFQEIRIIPRYDGHYYQIEFVYKLNPKKTKLDYNQFFASDLGLDNFATNVDTTGTTSIIDGMYIKSLNQWYNKENARLQSIKDKQGIKQLTNKQVDLLHDREHKVNEFLNLTVHHIVSHCLEHNIGNIVIGKFKDIKQNINLGKTTNQNFVQIPYSKFRQKLKSKCKLYRINYYEQEESYTSKCDALALEPIKKQKKYMGKRVKRGLFQSSTGTLINADVNGALNILRKFLYRKKKHFALTKVAIDSLIKGIDSRGLVNRPRRIRLAYHTPCRSMNCLQTSSELNLSGETQVKTRTSVLDTDLRIKAQAPS